MAKQLEIDVENKEIMEYLGGLRSKGRKALWTAVNKTTNHVKSQIAKEIGPPKGILTAPQKRIKSVIKLGKRPTISSPVGRIDISGRAMRLGSFKAKKTKKGVTFQIFKSGARLLAENAFIIKKGNFKGVFRRETNTFTSSPISPLRAGVDKIEIKTIRQLWGPAVTDVFEFSPETDKKIMDDALRFYNKEILSQISRQLEIPLSEARAEVFG